MIVYIQKNVIHRYMNSFDLKKTTSKREWKNGIRKKIEIKWLMLASLAISHLIWSQAIYCCKSSFLSTRTLSFFGILAEFDIYKSYSIIDKYYRIRTQIHFIMLKTTSKFHFWSDSIIKRVKFLLRKFVELSSLYITEKEFKT